MIKNKHQIDCLGMGIIPFDLLFTVDKYPKSNMKIDAASFKMQGGGPVPNVTVGLSRLGYKTALIASVGNDPFGEIGLEELRKENVNTKFMIIKKKPSAIATGWVESGSGKRTMVLSRQIFVKPKDLKLSKYQIPKILHLDGRDMEATLKLAKWGKRVGAEVSFDIGSIRNDVSAVFEYVDHLVVADTYAFSFTGKKTARQAILKLQSYCNGTIVVTEGIKGMTGFENSKFVKGKAFKVESVDTTGAGDAFHVGYLYGLLNNFKLEQRLKLGAAVSALKCKISGARSGLPNLNQLNKFLKDNPKTY